MPNDGTDQRKLATSLFTDMVGYPDASGAQRNEALAGGSVPQGRQIIAQRFIETLGYRLSPSGLGK